MDFQPSAKTAGDFTIALAGNPNVGKSTVFNALTMHAGGYGILRFFGLIFPQGIFYALAGYLLWTVVSEPVDGKEKLRSWAMIIFMMLGILTEIFINPRISALVFCFF